MRNSSEVKVNSENTDHEFKKNVLVIREQQVVASFQRRLMYQVSKSRYFVRYILDLLNASKVLSGAC